MNATQKALYPVFTRLFGDRRPDGRAPIFAITSPHTGVGASYVARNLALMAAQHYGPLGYRVGLIDLDLTAQAQSAFFQDATNQTIYGAIHGSYDATFGQPPFWQVSPESVTFDGNRQHAGEYCSLHIVAQTGLAFTQFNWSRVKDNQSVLIAPVIDYWDAMRDHFAVIIIDTPAFDRADTALAVIPIADKTVIINSSGSESDPANGALAKRIEESGGTCAGLIINSGPETSILGRHA